MWKYSLLKDEAYFPPPRLWDEFSVLHQNVGDPGSIPGKIHWKRDRLPTTVFLGFPCGSAGKESAHNAGDLGLIPGLGRFLGEGKGYPLQYSGLENSMDCIVHGIAELDKTERLLLSQSRI